MQPRQNRCGAVRATDFDGVMFIRAIFGAEDVQAGILGRAQRDTGRDHPLQPAEGQQMRRGHGRVDHAEVMGGGKTGAILKRDHKGGGQQARAFDQSQGQAVQIGVAVAAGLERAFHRGRQVIGGIGKALHPGQISTLGQRHARQIAIVGARLERFGAPAGQRQIGLHAQRVHIAQPLRRQGFDRQHQNAGAGHTKHHRHTHAQIGAGTGQNLGQIRS